jgi:hypothetical protein
LAGEVTMVKLDLVKKLSDLYRPPSDRAVLVEVPEMRYLMIDGEGDPNTSSDYSAAVQALYAASYALKFKVKRDEASVDYKVMPLEGLWWADDMTQFSVENKGDWKWTMMIVQPPVVTANLFEAAVNKTAKEEEEEEEEDVSALEKVRFQELNEGLSAQIMHLGPYSAEGPTIEKLHAFIGEKGFTPAGKHHEIYLGDPRRTAPERLKTVIRQPVTPVLP